VDEKLFRLKPIKEMGVFNSWEASAVNRRTPERYFQPVEHEIQQQRELGNLIADAGNRNAFPSPSGNRGRE